jgi:hypothetical protein
MSVDIVSLIENNPITKLNGNYHSTVVEKIKKDFTNYEQQLFVASFYCYLKYDKNDFVVDLDNIWNWLGFTQKVTSTNLLKKHFETLHFHLQIRKFLFLKERLHPLKHKCHSEY